MKKTLLTLGVVALGCLALNTGASAKATIVIVNLDGANEGFNDPTPVSPIGGNPGTTVGQQRLNCFNYAALIWSCILDSDVNMKIGAQFNPLSCTATSGTLGSTGASQVWSDFPGTPLANTWFVDAEADAHSGSDLNPAGRDMTATFNSNLGTTGCLDTSPWYYGLDLNAPGTSINLVTVLLHEFSHGLGFASLSNRTTGSLPSGRPDIFTRHLMDDTSGLHWDAMTNAQRAASTINTGNLSWDGANVTARVPSYMCQAAQLSVSSPAIIAGNYNAPLAAFSACNPNVTAPVVEVIDTTPPTADACEAITNDLTGKIALLDRGVCTFVIKVAAAQAAGAIGVIVVNNSAATPIEMGGTLAVPIPAVMISQADGATIRAQLGVGVTATIGTNPTRFSGVDAAGRMLMYAPNPSVSGSSVSHWDTSARPNLSMEPAINADLSHDPDFTVQAFKDILWLFNVAPTAIAQNIMVTGAGSPNCTADVQPADVNNGSFDANGDALTLSLDPPGPYAAGVTNVLLVVSDGCQVSRATAQITVQCPVAVNLASFSVAWAGTGAQLKWEITDATDHAGFQVFRMAPNGVKRQLSDRLITGGTKYAYTDEAAPREGADYWLTDVSRSGQVTWHGPLHLGPASASLPMLALSNAQPNPFQGATTISFVLPGGQPARLLVLDAQGRLVRRLLEGAAESGLHTVMWDGRDDAGQRAPGGLYFVKLLAGTEVRVQKVLLNH